MVPRSRIVLTVLIAALLLAACRPVATPTAMSEPAAGEMMEKTPEAMMESGSEMPSQDSSADMAATQGAEMMTAEPGQGDMSGGEETMMEAPAWFSAALTDVRSGQEFTISDHKGKVLLVETMAIWCTTCLAQQKQVVALHGLLGERDDFQSIGLDIDPNENSGDLQTYVERNNFDWVYAVSPAAVSSEIGSLYGDAFLNPPSAPMLIIDRHGEVHPLPFGVKSAEDLQDALEPFLNQGM